MNTASRRALQPIFQTLPRGYKGESYDDFINYTGGDVSARVVRFVGPGRTPVIG